MVTWQVHHDWQSVTSLWDALLALQPHRVFFQEHTVQKSWWESNGQPPLQIVVVHEEDKPIGLFPLVQINEKLQLLGDQDVSDYLDFILLPGKEAPAFSAFSEFLLTNKAWSKLELVSLPESSSTLTQLPQLAAHQHWSTQTTQQTVCPIIELPSSWDEYLSQVGKKQRHEIKRKWLRLEEQGSVNFRIVTDTNAQPDTLETFFTLHQQSSVEKAAFWTPSHRSFFERLSAAASQGGWLRLYFLDFNGQPAAAMYCFDYDNQLLIYNSGFDASAFADKSIGHVLTAYTIKDAIEQGKVKYDFLRGGEEYKMRYHPVAHPIFDLRVEKASDA